ncbi:hypothetical protein NSE01_40070 [Novosphingobium sediminis]|uniref:Uncharacterized protein n=1 Tax=Novosphingobium sediminis TaxID=707214 RepID=A0A512AR34_9SPHN|nr:hypothetical protein NSE01_40070 [Novosphingobium sediminis]
MSPAAAAARQVATSVSVAAFSEAPAEASVSETSLIQVCAITIPLSPRTVELAWSGTDKVNNLGQQVVNAAKKNLGEGAGYNLVLALRKTLYGFRDLLIGAPNREPRASVIGRRGG